MPKVGTPAKTAKPSRNSKPSKNGRAKTATQTKPPLEEICRDLQALQRVRENVIKSRIMVQNRLWSLVATGELGYHSMIDESDRKKKYKEAEEFCAAVIAGTRTSLMADLIVTTMNSIDAYNHHQTVLEKQMVERVSLIPLKEWIDHPRQRGFGLLGLAMIIGEAGNLSNYANPAKLWRRLSLAPMTYDGKTHMGKSWRMKKYGTLPAEKWEEYGYCPRRRSIMFRIGDSLNKQNGAGPYRQRWLQAKLRAYETHPEWEWSPCDKGIGAGKAKVYSCAAGGKVNPNCETCGGLGLKCGHAHEHGMLLATKLLVKLLWRAWQAMAKR